MPRNQLAAVQNANLGIQASLMCRLIRRTLLLVLLLLLLHQRVPRGRTHLGLLTERKAPARPSVHAANAAVHGESRQARTRARASSAQSRSPMLLQRMPRRL